MTGLRASVQDRSGVVVRSLQAALRALRHPGDQQSAVQRMDRGVRLRAADGSATRSADASVHILEMNGENYRLQAHKRRRPEKPRSGSGPGPLWRRFAGRLPLRPKRAALLASQARAAPANRLKEN